jgi:hypothetical protein
VEMAVTVRYPDGRINQVTYDESWLQEAGAVLFAESCMTDEQVKQFHKSDDWMENPTFLKWERGHRGCGASCAGGGTCVDCCDCTSCVMK